MRTLNSVLFLRTHEICKVIDDFFLISSSQVHLPAYYYTLQSNHSQDDNH